MKRAVRYTTGLLILLISSISAWAEDWQYSMRPGDDLWSIARKYCGSAKKAADIASYNEVPDPADVRAGTRINIPVKWLVFEPSSAKVVHTNEVVVRITEDGQRHDARAGDILNMGDVIETAGGAAVVQFADGSTIAIQPDSKVLFNKLTAFGPAGMVDTHLRFSYGRGTATVQRQNRGDRFRVQTPEGIAAVRGTVFRIGRARTTAAFTNTETLTGLVDFEQATAATSVPGGFGVAASNSGVVKEALLPAPVWQTSAGEIGVAGTLAWENLTDAQSYVVTWSHASNPDVVVHRATTSNPSVSVNVTPGEYAVGLRGVSANGIEGVDSSRTFKVRGRAPHATRSQPGHDGQVTLSWQHSDDTASDYVVIMTNTNTNQTTERTHSSDSLTLALAPGNYAWHVAAVDSARSSVAFFDLQPASVTDVKIHRKGKVLSLNWGANDQAEQYHLVLTPEQSELSPINLTTKDNQARIEVPEFGNYRLSLASEQSNLHSTPRYETVRVTRRPWWLFLLTLPILAL